MKKGFLYSIDCFESLKKGEKEHKLIDVCNLRQIGKTSALISFARLNNYSAIVKNLNYAREYADKHCSGYKNIYADSINSIRGLSNINVVVDEGVDVDRLIKNGFNVITGYYTPTNNNKQDIITVKEISDTLNNELKMLIPKITKARENNEFGTYKNLILAFKEVIELSKYINS
jgi:hypothetical protein